MIWYLHWLVFILARFWPKRFQNCQQQSKGPITKLFTTTINSLCSKLTCLLLVVTSFSPASWSASNASCPRCGWCRWTACRSGSRTAGSSRAPSETSPISIIQKRHLLTIRVPLKNGRAKTTSWKPHKLWSFGFLPIFWIYQVYRLQKCCTITASFAGTIHFYGFGWVLRLQLALRFPKYELKRAKNVTVTRYYRFLRKFTDIAAKNLQSSPILKTSP